MKNEKVCPKCTSLEILRVPGMVHHYGGGNYIGRGVALFGNSLVVLVTRYVCTICGYVEEWIEKKEDIAKLVERISKENEDEGKFEEGGESNFTETPPWEKRNIL